MAGFNSNIEYSTPRMQSNNSDFISGFNKALPSNPSRETNLNTSQSRMRLPLSDAASKGVKTFRNFSPKPQAQEPNIASQYRNLSNADLERVRGLDAQELQANINRVKQYEPLANNEANRAMGMSLATQLPYSSFEENLKSMRQAGVNATSLTSSIAPAYNSSVSKLSPVSLSL